jgi:hypothetical protein
VYQIVMFLSLLEKIVKELEVAKFAIKFSRADQPIDSEKSRFRAVPAFRCYAWYHSIIMS